MTLTSQALPRSRPGDQAVAAAGIDSFLDAVDEHGLELHSLMVLRHGRVVAEGWWAPYTPDRKHLLYSLSKSFTSIAVGMAVDAGLVGLDDRVLDHLAGYTKAGTASTVHGRYRRFLLRHALSMATGHEAETIDRVDAGVTADTDGESLRGFFNLPPDREPGSVFAYNQLATYCAARVLGAATGQRLSEWLRPRLFDPLGSDEAQWLDYDGYEMAFAGLHVRTETVAAFGQLLLQGGRWGERQLVSRNWVLQATTLQMPNDVDHLGPGAVADPDSDWQQGYGFQFWMNRHGFRGDGAFGQCCIVWPDEDAVIVTTAEVADMRLLLNLIYDHLRPAMHRPPAGPDADAALAARLAGLAIRPPTGSEAAFTGTFAVREDGQQPAVPGLRRVVVDPVGPDWGLTFERDAGPVRLPVGRHRWSDGRWPAAGPGLDDVPFVAAAAVAPDGGWHAELRMIQTPHTLLVDAGPTSGTATVGWRMPPLNEGGPDVHSLPSVSGGQ